MRAEEVYVDPSGLSRLYLHEDGSRAMAAWRTKTPVALPVTHHGRTEIVNALCRAAFLGHLDRDALAECVRDLTADFVEGRLRQPDILWRAALDRASELSQKHTPELGTRSLDVLHVACALELKLQRFLTFDSRQRELAKRAGLRVISL
jgi:predicted nucleic acid-binding protein